MKTFELKRITRLLALAMLVPTALIAAPGAENATTRFETTSMSHVEFNGSVGYTISNGTVTLEADEVVNNGSSSTNTLYLQLWATTQSSPTGSGYEIGTAELGSLGVGEYYYDIVLNTSYDAPPDGTYYMHMLLLESPDLNSIVDSVTFSSTETFTSSTGGGGSDGGGDGGGSDDGGGAMHPLLLIGIALWGIFAVRRRS